MGVDKEGGFSKQPGTQGFSNYRNKRNVSSKSEGTGEKSERPKPESDIPDEEQVVVLVSNIPANLSNPESIFYAFEKFGTVDRVKVLHAKRNTALVQFSDHAGAVTATEEQDKLNRCGGDIFVSFSTKFRSIRLPEPGSVHDDGLTKDFTGQFPDSGVEPPPVPYNQQGGFQGGFNDQQQGNFGGNMMGGGRGPMMGGGQNYGFNNMQGGGPGAPGGQGGGPGSVVIISNIPDEVANLKAIFNMAGAYGDVTAVKILRNKRDCALVQLAKPHQAQQVRNFLDQAKIGGKKLCVSFSHAESIFIRHHKDDDDSEELQGDFSVSRNHRFRNHHIAAKLQKNLCPPSATLHVANLPEDMSPSEVKEMFIEQGFTVKETKECGSNNNQALLTMAGPDEALMALSMMHNYAPDEYKFPNKAGLCVSFSARPINK